MVLSLYPDRANSATKYSDLVPCKNVYPVSPYLWWWACARMYAESVQLVIEGSRHWTALCFAKLLTFAVAMLFLMGGLACTPYCKFIPRWFCSMETTLCGNAKLQFFIYRSNTTFLCKSETGRRWLLSLSCFVACHLRSMYGDKGTISLPKRRTKDYNG